MYKAPNWLGNNC